MNVLIVVCEELTFHRLVLYKMFSNFSFTISISNLRELVSPLHSLKKNLVFSSWFLGNRHRLTQLNSLNIKSKIWRWFLTTILSFIRPSFRSLDPLWKKLLPKYCIWKFSKFLMTWAKIYGQRLYKMHFHFDQTKISSHLNNCRKFDIRLYMTGLSFPSLFASLFYIKSPCQPPEIVHRLKTKTRQKVPPCSLHDRKLYILNLSWFVCNLIYSWPEFLKKTLLP